MYAAIDIGTNSVRLLLYDASTGDKRKLLCTTRIGEGLAASGRISPAGMERTHRAVVDYLSRAMEAGARVPVYCYATSAVREAENGEAFMERLLGLHGLSAEVLSGEEEAEYGFYGAAKGGSGVVMDIGGGSTELTRGEGGRILSSQSIVLGCVSSFERFLHTDPPTTKELSALREHAAARAGQLCRQVLCGIQPQAIIGIGGTATQLAMVSLGLKEYDPVAVNGTVITTEQLSHLFEALASMPMARRRALAGMDPQRADVIVTGAIIALEILLAARCPQLITCDDDGLDGYLMAKIRQNG